VPKNAAGFDDAAPPQFHEAGEHTAGSSPALNGIAGTPSGLVRPRRAVNRATQADGTSKTRAKAAGHRACRSQAASRRSTLSKSTTCLIREKRNQDEFPFGRARCQRSGVTPHKRSGIHVPNCGLDSLPASPRRLVAVNCKCFTIGDFARFEPGLQFCLGRLRHCGSLPYCRSVSGPF
jgi:hypothetical protein